MADFFRGILASILLATGKDSPATLVLTSPSPKEGKTTNAANLAVALASIGKRVLLIDADLRKPRLHEIFDVRNTKGFSDLLVEHSQSNTAKPLSYVQETKIPGLSVLTSGGSRASGSNLLYGPWVPHVLNEFRQHFDTVLLDAPPVLSLADARLLSRHGDGVVLVCRAGATSRERAKIALELLTRDGANVIGTILNDFDTKASSYYRDVYDSSYSEAAG
jgi:capsular exopolysaccharide synthesis family protein